MEPALAEVEFLARSPNRVAVLQSLAEGQRTRNELADATGASQATLGRILSDFEERSWVARDGSRYEATATGELVARGVGDLLSIVETERELRDIVAYLPTEDLGFDLRRLADATVTVPTETRPNAPVRRLLDLTRAADRSRAFSHAFNEQSLGLTAERATAGELDFEGVFSRSAIDAIAGDAELRRRLVTLLDADGATVRVCDDGIPVAATVLDDTVHLLVRDDSGVLRASVDTDDEAVRDWAVGTFDRYWERAAPIDAGDLR
jgi:predicted transcriptional regulator